MQAQSVLHSVLNAPGHTKPPELVPAVAQPLRQEMMDSVCFQASKRITECLDYLEQETREQPVRVPVALAFASCCEGHVSYCRLCKQPVPCRYHLLHVWQVNPEPSHSAVSCAVALAEIDAQRDAEIIPNFSPNVHRTRFWQTHFGVSSASVFVEEGLSQVRIYVENSCASGCCLLFYSRLHPSCPTVSFAPRR